MELEIENTEVVSADNIQIEAPGAVEVIEGEKDYEVSVVKKEYTIIGDSIFIPSMYEDAPPWLKEFIDTTLEVAITNRDQSLIDRMEAILTLMDYVPKNMYTEQINQIVSEDGIINSRIATLNSNLTDALSSTNATIAEINLTYASKDEAAAIATNVITASLSGNGEIGSALIQLQEAYADLESTTAQSINMLESVMEGEINGNATAMETIRTYVGIDSSGGAIGTGLLTDVKLLQKQNDGIIETVTGTYDVMVNPENPDLAKLVLTAEPYATWKAADVSGIDTRLAHIGDVYIKYSITGNGAREYIASYKFIRTVVDTTSPFSTDNHGFTWALIVDQAAQDAYNQALSAYDLADGKRRVYVGLGAAGTPKTPYDQGDLWLIDTARIVNGYSAKVGDILRCVESKGVKGATYEQNDWVLASSYANAIQAEATALEKWKNTTYASTITTLQTQVDKKAETFYQNSMPSGRLTLTNVVADVELDKYVGDLWKNTYVGTISGYLGNNTEYMYSKVANGTKWDYKWVEMEVPDIVFDAIDTKKAIFVGNTLPVNPEINDMWITGDAPVGGRIAKTIYTWNGILWIIPVRYTDDQYAKDIVAGTTQIDLSDHINTLGWQTESEVNNAASSTLATWISATYTPEQVEKQALIDGKIESYFQSTAPYAASSGTASKDGDLWYNTSTKKLYRYVFSSKTWSIIEDQTAINAAAAASTAQSTADGKIVTFLQSEMPTAISDEGDIWIDTNDDNHMYRADANGQWASVRDTTNDVALAVALADIGSLEETNDGVVNSFYQTSAPTTGMSYGDWWIDTDSSPLVAYRYEDVNGKNVGVMSWRNNSTHILGKAYIGAVGAQSTADGKIKTFYQAGIPTSEGLGDLWIDTDDNNKTYRAAIKGANEIKAGEWVRVTDESALDNFLVSTYSTDLLNTKNQIDGVAVTYFQAAAPYLATAGTAANSGDVWYDTDAASVTAYKFVYKILGTDGSTVVSPSVWEPITNTFVLSSLEAASKTKAAADRSIKNFTTTTVPSHPFYIGDTWMEGSSGNIYVCNANSLSSDTETQRRAKWVIASKYTDDTSVTALQNGLANGTTTIKLTNAYVGTVPLTTYLSSEIDGKVGVYSGTIAPVAGQPSGVAVNDIYLWFTTRVASGKTYDITVTYKYNGSAWVEITTNDDITNLADLADGKRTIFGGATVPTGALDRDIWIPSANNGSYVKGEIYQYIGGVWSVTTRYTADMQALTSNVQTQIDSKVDTYYQDTVPFANATNVARKTQAGDYWYCTLTSGSYVKGKMYKYTETANGSNWNYTWTETADVTKYAFDLADGKASIFTTSAQPSSYKINDMMIVTTANFSNGTTTFSNGVVLTSNAIRVSGFVAADWVKKINDTEDLDEFVSVTYTPTITSLQNQVDGKIESWYTASTSDPKIAWTDAATRAKHEGDMWYQTNTKKSYWYSSSTHSWNLIDDEKAIQALANAATAQATADGVVVSFYAIKQDTAPTTTSMWLNKTGTKVLKEYKASWINVAVQTGDTLMAYDPVTKDMSTYVYNGSGWITNTENGIVAGSEAITTLTANLSATNTTVGGHTTQLNTVDTRIANGVASVETKWAYNSVVNINGASYQSGFGLATSLTSGSGLPTGASEFWIKADKFKLMSADGGKKSSYSPFSVDATTGDITFNGKVTFSNITGYTPPTIPTNLSEFVNDSGYVLPTGVAAAVNSNTTTINGSKITTGSIAAAQIGAGTITSDKISTYNLTAANSTFENGIITNAKIADASISTAKIGDLSVSTLKIQDEAVVVPRSASGGYSCSIWYSPTISHAVSILGEWVQGDGRDRVATNISVNGILVRSETPTYGTLCSMFYNTYFYAGVTYSITLHTAREVGYMTCRMLLLGTKR